jgi:hypothetical protein
MAGLARGAYLFNVSSGGRHPDACNRRGHDDIDIQAHA